MTVKKWPKGYTPNTDSPSYLQEGFAHEHFAEQVRTAALEWATANLKGDEVGWADGFADWAADKSRWRLGNFTMPSFARWWKTYYAEPLVDDSEGDEDEDE